MKFLPLIFFLSFCFACQTKTKSPGKTHPSPAITQQPNFNYTLEVPGGWETRDTIMEDGLKVRFLVSPGSLMADNPTGNILISSMEGWAIDEFTTRNINYLKANMPGITILERGNIKSSVYNGQWFTYTKEQNGMIRDMINYIIPLNGFAYMITCGVNNGSIKKYRETFDRIAESFKG